MQTKTILYDYRTWAALVAFLSSLLSLVAQPMRVTSYRHDQGLPNNLVKAILHDKQGFTWLGTDDGVVRFDGKRFVHCKNALSSQYIKAMVQCRDGRIIVAHDDGIAEIVNKPDSIGFRTLFKGTTELSDTSVQYPKSLFESTSGELWIGEAMSIVRTMNGKILKRYVLGERSRTQSFARSFAFAQDSLVGLIVSSQTGLLFRYDALSDSFHEIATPEPLLVVSSLVSVRTGIFYLGCFRGLYELDCTQPTKPVLKKLISLPDISTLTFGAANNLYTGTWNQGLYRVQFQDVPPVAVGSGGRFFVKKVDNITSSVVNALQYSPEFGLMIAADDGFWLAQALLFGMYDIPYQRFYIQAVARIGRDTIYATDGRNIYVISYRNNIASTRIIASPKPNNFILSLAFANDKLWWGFQDGSIGVLEPKSGLFTSLRDDMQRGATLFINADAEGNVWYSRGGVLYCIPRNSLTLRRYQAAEGILTHPTVFRQMPNGTFYVGAKENTSYLYRYNAQKDCFENVSIPIQSKKDVVFAVNDIAGSSDGRTLWLASNQGLVKVVCSSNGLPMSAERIVITNPLDNVEVDMLKSITLSPDGAVWIGTEVGIFRYQAGVFSHFNDQAGLPSNSCVLRAMQCDDKGGLWVGTSGGLGFGLFAMTRRVSQPPLLYSVSVNGKRILPNNPTVPNAATIQIEFASLVYPGEKTMYQYRVLGLDSLWSQPLLENSCTLFQVPRGDYTLEVRSLRSGGYDWSNVLRVPFNVESAWYQRSWAILLMVVSIVGSVWSVLLLNDRRSRRKNEVLRRLVDEQTSELQAANSEIQRQMEILDIRAQEVEVMNSQLHQSYQNLAILSDIGQKITSSLDLNTIGMRIYDNMNTLFDAPVLVICLHDTERHEIRYELVLENRQLVPAVSISMTETTIPSVQCVLYCKEIVIQEGDIEVVTGSKVNSLIYFPLIVEEYVIGAFSVQSFKSNAFSEHDISFMRTIVPSIASALSNVRTYRQIRETTKDLEILESVVRSINEAPSIEGLLRIFLESAIKLVPRATAGSIFVLDAKQTVFRVASGIGYDDEELRSLEFNKDDFLEEWWANTMLLAPNVSIYRAQNNQTSGISGSVEVENLHDKSYRQVWVKPTRGKYTHADPLCTIGIPIEISSQIEGFLFLDNHAETFAFSAKDAEKLALLHQHLITAFSKLRIIQTLTQQRMELTIIEKIVQSVNQGNAFDSILDEVLRLLLPLFPQADKASVFIFDEERQCYRFAMTIGYEWETIKNISIGIDEAKQFWKMDDDKVWILREFWGTNEGEKFEGVATTEKVGTSNNILAALCMPIHIQGKVVGGVFLDSFESVDAFDETDIEKMNRVREHVIVAFTKMFTIKQLELSNTELKEANGKIEQQSIIVSQQSLEIKIANEALQEQLETLRRTQTQLAQAEKMASLGTLVAGVAHELNTPIGVAVTAASTLHGKVQAFENEYKAGGLKKSTLEAFMENAKIGADLTLRNLERAANLIQSFKQVAVDQTSDSKRVINLKHYLEGVITSLEPKWKTTSHRVEIECDERVELETYPGAIAQIITNLVTNSLLHGFEGYREDGLMKIVVARDGGRIKIEYSDNGRGIPPEVLPRIFDPFFTTKQAQGGTGLGMHIVYNLTTQKLGGEILCFSSAGTGTTFSIKLPFLE